MKKKILSLILCALVVVSSVPATPVSDLFSVQAVAVDIETLQSVYDAAPKEEEWGNYVNGSSIKGYYKYAEAILNNSSAYSQNEIDECAADLRAAVDALEPYATGIALDKSSVTLAVGRTAQLSAELLPAGSGGDISWTSSHSAFVSVSADGLVSANRYTADTVTIEATVSGKDAEIYSATCQVKVTNPVAGISLSSNSLTLYNGETATLTTKTVGMDSTATPSDEVIYTWDSDDTSVALVENGVITTKGVGTCTVTVKVRNLNDTTVYSDTCAVTVNRLVPVQSLIPDALSMMVSGQKLEFSVSFMPSNASVKNLSWMTSASDVVNYSDIRVEDGKAVVTLTAGKIGTAKLTFTATDGSGISGSITVVVRPMITDLTLSHTSKAISLGSVGERIYASVTPADAGYQVLEWSSDNQRVCTVDYNGVLTPVSSGECNITAATKDGSEIVKSCKVIVCEPVSSIKINAPATTVENGNKLYLSATVTTTDGYVYTDAKWTSSDTSIATVDFDGVVTAKYPGSVAIKAEAVDGSGKYDNVVIRVIQKITGLYIQPSATVSIGDSFTLTPSITPSYATERNLSWSTSNIGVASVNAEGLVTAKNVGTAKITCTSSDGLVSAVCTVNVIVPATGITISSASEELWKGDVVQLVAIVSPSNASDKSVKWSSSNSNVASVTSDGLVTAVAGGRCVITATNSAGKTDSCIIQVYENCTGVELESSVKAMYVGQVYTMTASVIPSSATNKNVTWSSSEPSVAKVSESGVIEALTQGSTVITVTTVSGAFTASCTVTVHGKIPVTSLVLDRRSVTVPVGVIDQLIASLSPTNCSEKGVVWSCDNTSVLEFNQKGQFRGRKAGTAILTATSVDGKYTDQCRVTVIQPVTGVRITTTDVRLAINKSKALSWNVFPEDATNKSVAWSSSNKTVATVDKSGVVTAHAAGTTVITVSTVDGGYTSTCNFTVYVPVTGVSIQEDIKIAKGTSNLLSAIISPSNATNQAVSWVSSNTSIVRVNESGQITGMSTGTANVTCTTADGAYRATCVVTVYQLAESVSLDITSATIEAGKTKTIVAKMSPSSATYKTFKWSSSDSKIATVDDNGLVKAVSAGVATITATSFDNNAKASCRITVTQPVTGVTLNVTSGYVRIGEVGALKATVLPSNATNQKVTWSTSDKTRATVSEDGVVKGISQGYVTITATTVNGGFTASCKVLVVKSVTGIKLNKASITIDVGKTTTITPTVYPTDATVKTVSWTSSNYDVINVDSAGKITAKAPGYAIVTAKTKDGSFTAKTEILVIQPVTGITLNKTSSYLNLNATMTLVATISPSNASIKSVTWTSSNPSIATVSSSGVVTGIKTGIVTITCKTTNGAKTASCKIGVVKRVTGITLDKEEAIVYFGHALTLKPTIYPLDASVKDVIYSSTDTNVASVSAAGVVTPVNTGTAHIVATTVDGSYKAYCKIHVGKAPEQIKLSVYSATMLAGNSGTLKYAVYPTDARNRAATFSTSNSAVATVSSTGLVTAVSRGTANIIATTENGIKAVCRITVVQPVKGIEISAPTAEVYTSEKITLSAKVLPENANNQTVIWSSSDNRIATVSSSGVVSGVKAGTVTITATSDDGAYEAKCTVTVKQHVSAIEFTDPDIFINKGSEAELRYSVLPYDATDKSVTFESSDRSIVEVTSEGKIIAHLGGRAVITVTSKDTGVSAKCYVTVQEPVQGVSLSCTEKTIFVGESFELVATVSPSDATNKLVGWSSDNAIASVDSKGVVTALKSGTAKITATTLDGGYTASCTFTLLQRATGLAVSEGEIKVNRGESYKLEATVAPEDCYNREYTWSSADEAIAVVNPSTGEVTGVAAGNVILTCISNENAEIKATVSVTVHEPVTRLEITNKAETLFTPDTYEVQGKVYPENASDKSVTWSSSDEEIATVSQDGTITALKKGEVVITLTSNDVNTVSDSFTLQVLTGVEGITTEKEEYSLHENTSLQLIPGFNPEEVDDSRVEYESSDESIFTVSPEGVVTGVLLGKAELTIRSLQNPQATKTVTINVTRAVTSISFDITSHRTNTGESFSIEATVCPEDASDKSFVFASSDESVAIVSQTGEVTALSRGSVTITATTNDGSFKAECQVEVVQLPEEILFGKEEYIVRMFETITLDAAVLPENTNNPSLIWESSDEEIATVENGVVTPVKPGSCEITAICQANEDITARVKVNVIRLAERIDFFCRIPDLFAGERLRVFATVTPADTTDKSVIWSSSDEKIATINEYGVITAVSAGNVQLTAAAADGSGVTACFSLRVVEEISEIRLDRSFARLEINEEITLVAEVLPEFAYDKSVKFESSNPQVATVDANGKVTALANGKATITATTADGNFIETAEIVVEKLPTGIDILKSTTMLKPGEKEKLEFVLVPADATATQFSWMTSDEKVAAVSEEGVITAIGNGTANITVSIVGREELFDVIEVTVSDEAQPE